MVIHFYTHEDCLDHNPGVGHPENPQRLSRILMHWPKALLTSHCSWSKLLLGRTSKSFSPTMKLTMKM